MTTSCPTNRQAMNSVWYTVYIIGSQGAVSFQPCWWNRMETVYQHKEEGSPCLKLSNAVWGWRRRKGSKPVLRLRAKKKENQDVYWSKTLYSAVIRTSQPKVHRLIGLRQQKCRVETLRLKQQLDIRSTRKKIPQNPSALQVCFSFFPRYCSGVWSITVLAGNFLKRLQLAQEPWLPRHCMEAMRAEAICTSKYLVWRQNMFSLNFQHRNGERDLSSRVYLL